ncbi:restriction endonuclease subunit S [Metabacillus fastidiosus]|uniref:restriction endonuclease subunit S n=1 Tax=Metabacillus fastidiosus TaxID=1458 RepID=UPI003D2972DD
MNYKLRELLEDKGYIRGPFGSALKRNELKTHGIPVYEQQNAINNHRNFRYYIDEKKYEELKRFTVRPNDLVISCSGTVGKITLIKQDDPKGIISQALLILRPDTSKILPEFLFYFFISSRGYNSIISRSSGSVQVNIAKREIIEDIEIEVPSKEEQIKIISLLKTIDNKIELNNRINKTMEELAQSIFTRWFLHFEFPNEEGLPYKAGGGNFKETDIGDIPQEWELKDLNDVTFINPRETLKKGEQATYVEMANLPVNSARVKKYVVKAFAGGTKFRNGDILFARITPCLENGKTAIVDFLESEQIGFGSTEYIIMRPSYLNSYFLYCLARSSDFRNYAIKNMNGSSGRQRVDAKIIKKYKICCPDKRLLARFNTFCESLFLKMKKNDDESISLQQIRDKLLPKLMSGKVHILEEKKEVEECLQKSN